MQEQRYMSFKIDDENIRTKIKIYAALKKMTVSQIMQEAFNDWFEKNRVEIDDEVQKILKIIK